MIRISAIVWVVVLALLGIGLFQVKYNVQSKERELREVRKQIDTNLNSIRVLEAEWSYLNDPLRLADLARRHTDLVPTTPAQIGDLGALPPRIEDSPVEPEATPAPAEPPLVSSAPQAPAQSEQSVVQVKAPAEADAAPTQQEPQPLKPKDEQAEGDAVIDAILADMEKAQQLDAPQQEGGAQ